VSERGSHDGIADESSITSTEQYRVIGTSPLRYDAGDKVTGRAVYGADVRQPDMLYGRALRSPHAHARIRSIDTAQAEALPGVLAVVTAGDLLRPYGDADGMAESALDHAYRCDNVLASDKVLHVGHAIAAVAARSSRIAEQAIQLIEVEYEILPPVLDVLEAARDGVPLLHEHMRTRSLSGLSQRPSNVARHFEHIKGHPQKGFAEADVVVEREFRTTTVHQGYIEPPAATALWSADGTLTVHTTTQGSFGVRRQLAELLRCPLSKIRVVPTEVGGGFGGKNPSYVEPLCALLARKAGHPVKMAMTRAEVFLATWPTPGSVIRVRIGAKRDGRMTAARAELYYEAGAYPGSFVGSGIGVTFTPYDVPHGQIDAYEVVVNKPKTGAYRAPCATQATFAVEVVVDELVEELGIDPLEFRILNTAKEGTRRIDGPMHPRIGSYEVLQAAKAHPHYRAPLAGVCRGRGVAHGFWRNGGGRSGSAIHVNSDGTVALTTGSVDLTGTRTSLAMIVAEELGLSLEQIRSTTADTDSISYTDGTYASRTTIATGTAVVKAARDVVAQMSERAAMLWGVPPDEVSFHRGAFTAEGDSSMRLLFGELAALQSETGGLITGVGNVNVSDWGGSFGTHIVDVEVDAETGRVTILRYTVVQDVGRAIHPVMIEGQIAGGTAQGIGWALHEGYQYDEQGRMLNPDLLDYKIPTMLDVPSIETVIVEVPYPGHPYGVRGAGEMPIVPAPAAIANAIYRATGARVYQLPMTPARILEGMGVI
jgi:xanthine dehydrogenase molybdenum-binding subunit